MELRYLGGRSWTDITREERFYCQHLFNLIKNDPASFVSFVNQKLNTSLPTSCNWEPAFEVCFYRDLFYDRGKPNPYSPKRTFDLCLFSDDAILIIEAKAQQGFNNDDCKPYKRDRERVQKVTGVSQVVLAGLASSKYDPSQAVRTAFCDTPLLTWQELAELYKPDPTLRRADCLYDPHRSNTGGGDNTNGYMTGEELIAAYKRGEKLVVGRKGGLKGKLLDNDVQGDRWSKQKYETSRNDEPPNANWFTVGEFVNRIKSASAV